MKELTKDNKFYVLDSAVVYDWYGVDARLEAAWAPEDLEIGDKVHFTVEETGSFSPAVNWVEKRKTKKPAKRKDEAEEKEVHAPEKGAELYMGKVGNPTKDGSMYLVHCPVVNSWCKVPARVSGETLLLVGAGPGDEILFSVAKPQVDWAVLAVGCSRRERSGEEPIEGRTSSEEAEVSGEGCDCRWER